MSFFGSSRQSDPIDVHLYSAVRDANERIAALERTVKYLEDRHESLRDRVQREIGSAGNLILASMAWVAYVQNLSVEECVQATEAIGECADLLDELMREAETSEEFDEAKYEPQKLVETMFERFRKAALTNEQKP